VEVTARWISRTLVGAELPLGLAEWSAVPTLSTSCRTCNIELIRTPDTRAAIAVLGVLVLPAAVPHTAHAATADSRVTITLFIPCFVDLMFPNVGICMVRILERLGHTVVCPGEIACCGQPPFNSGYWDEARAVASKVLHQLRDAETVVIASGSCGAMLKNFYPQLFAGTPTEAAARALSAKCHEFSDFLVTRLGVTDLGARFPARVTFHDGCHGLRELGIRTQPRLLLSKVRDLQLVEMRESETCCGFGGTFAAKFPMISSAMGDVKCVSALETSAEYIVSNDSSCLMHLQGLIDRRRVSLKTIHLAEILANQEPAI
jgi:L-lactate dehydrogenase complex protein LldE